MPEFHDNEDGQDGLNCSSCANFTQRGEPHRWKWWEWAPAVVMILGFVGGLIIFGQRQADANVDLDRRVTVLEKAREQEEKDRIDLLTRISRMEPMLEFVFKKAGGQ